MLKKTAILLLALIITMPLVLFSVQAAPITENASQKIDEGAKRNEGAFDFNNSDKNVDSIEDGVYSLGFLIMDEARRLSYPICILGIVAGALVQQVFGPKNVPRRILGRNIMMGFFSVCVVIHIATVVLYYAAG